MLNVFIPEMTQPNPYPKEGYKACEQITLEHPNTGDWLLKSLKLLSLITPIIFILSLFSAIPNFWVFVGIFAIVTSILLIVKLNIEGNKVIGSCPSCNKKLSREEFYNVEYFTCHTCKLYKIGRCWT